MTKKSGPSRTRQGIRGGMTISEAHHLYGKGGDDCTEKTQVKDYLGMRREGEYAGDGMIKMPLTRNQRRLAKKLGIELKEV
ncbi:hypothetical protein AHV09_07565 [Salmonella enterica subsp. enterica]|nr:hypothetical protein [Salmonella enterica subsp. enterica serovar Gombe]EHE6021812.1 hypothetical protein [Salmonella enterica]EIM5529127.1 hypothetical protein [Salmonella enterica subsp. enterica]HDC2548177.1 hypothetical protein [Salmonella enterica]HDC2558703.1 hypothetical protein [Salmonella enterica]